MKYIFILGIFQYIFCNIDLTIKYLKDIEIQEKINSIYVFKLNNSKYDDIILKSLTLPTITLQNGLEMNYLNFPKFESASALKYYFNSEFLALIFMENFEKNDFRNTLLQDIIWYSRDQIIVIISEKSYKNAVNILLNFRQQFFVNVIFLCIENFEYSITYELFPILNIIPHFEFKKETMKNVKKYTLNIICNNKFPFSYCSVNENNMLQGMGRIFHLVDNFIDFINGSEEYFVETENEFQSYDNLRYVDLWTNIIVTPIQDSLALFPFSSEINSNILEAHDMFIIIPKASFIDPVLYVTRPFSIFLWTLCFVYLIYGSSVVAFSNHLIKKDSQFWTIFDQLLRSLLAQSFNNALPGLRMTVIYLLAIIFGFVITTFYSAFLGSFLTTYIRKPQISTLSEFKEANMKIIYEGEYINTTYGFEDIKDLLIRMMLEDKMLAIQDKNPHLGIIFHSTSWEITNLNEKYVSLNNFYLEYNFIKLLFPVSSMFKSRFNRYIEIVKETGLYNIWKRQLYYEARLISSNELLTMLKITFRGIEDNRRILNINYFLYPFCFLIFVYMFCICVFLVEVFWRRSL